MTSLSKSRYVVGTLCPKLLWWTAHEPAAPELQPDLVLRDLFDQGTLVGERARAEWPDGVLIAGERRDPLRVGRTREAIDAGAGVLFEASFDEDGVFCAVDVLTRGEHGWTLIEVKSSSEVKDIHLPDVAVQVYAARRAGIDVTRAEVMHLNREYRLDGSAPLFVRADVTEAIAPALAEVPARIAEQLSVLAGPLPTHTVGAHCWGRGSECAFFDRCWPDDPDHIRHLWSVGPKKTVAWMAKGVHTMRGIGAAEKLNEKQQRQLRAQRTGELIVEPGLASAMEPAMSARHLGFLDFETVGRALPPWPDLGPWHQAAAQFSYHERRRGTDDVRHVEFLAEGPDHPDDPATDPREPLARAMLAATENADRIVVYSSFESTRIKELALHLPALADDLHVLRAKLWDLQPAVSTNVYHPDFRGSYSLKYILHPLVPELSYDDLVIVDGMVASVQIARLLFVSGRIPPGQRDQTRRDLLAYCERDTFATVRLVERLSSLAMRGVS